MMSNEKFPLVCVVGPTASGKTGLAAAISHRLDGEVVSADSMQIYRGLSIGTAKPTKEEMGGIPHHMIDFLSPEERFSVADYAAMARGVIFDIHERGKLPVLAGGTGLYVQAVTEGILFQEEPENPEIRRQLEQRAEKDEIEALFQELQNIDPPSAQRIDPSNEKRVIRALEIYYLTGETMTRRLEKSRPKDLPFRPVLIGLNFADRQRLYDRIEQRVDQMMDSGLLEEAGAVLNHLGITASGAIGYKEFIPYFQGKITIEEAVEQLKRDTRRYAKRQLTWFKRDARIHWILADREEGVDGILQNSLAYLKKEGIIEK